MRKEPVWNGTKGGVAAPDGREQPQDPESLSREAEALLQRNKSWTEMSLPELVALRDLLHAEISRRILGDPRVRVHVGPDGCYSTINGKRIDNPSGAFK